MPATTSDAVARSRKSVPSAPTTEAVVAALRRISRAIDVQSRELLRRWGLTTPQLIVLREIASRGETSGSELARAVSLSPPTVAGILARLASRHLIERQRSPRDRRSLLVTLTPEGQRLVAEAPSPLRQRFSDRFEELDNKERREVLNVLERVASMMEGE